jgi:hypothetical protein
MRLVALVLLALAAEARAEPGVRVFASADKAITEGETVVDGDPRDVYEAMRDYRRWTEVFPDLAQVVVTRETGSEARVTLVARDGHHDNLHFKNRPAATTVWFEDTGSKHAVVWAEIAFAPGARPATTRVHARLYARVHGIASIVVRSGRVRREREAKVAHDLASIRAYFRRR